MPTPRRHAVLLLAAVVALVPTAARGELPAPGSTYHILFATAGLYRTTTSTLIPPPTLRFNGIAGADYHVTAAAADAELTGTAGWDGVTLIYRAILSISGDNARDRLSVSGPVFNLHGDQLATSHADLFDGSLAAPVAYDEFGQLITANTDVWSGCAPDGTAGGQSCSMWNNVSNGASGRIGSVSDTGPSWLGGGLTKACNLVARLYGLSPALVAPLWGDYDGSGTVDAADYVVWRNQLGSSPATPQFYSARAFTSTGPVSDQDYEVWKAHFGMTLPAGTTQVPEPAALVLLAIGLVAAVKALPAR